MNDSKRNRNFTYETGIVLSGGAHRSLGHVGALKALVEQGIRPDIICGTSSGAIVAVLYASGYSPEEIFNIWQKESFNEVMEPHIPLRGFLKSSKIMTLVRPYMKYERLENLPVPVLISSTCMNNGKQKIFDEGEILPRLGAACALPVLFEPVTIEGRQYADGGLVSNLPVEPLEGKCRRLIGIYVNTVPEKEDLGGLKSIILHTIRIGLNSSVKKTSQQCDWFIAPEELGKRGLFDDSVLEENFSSGYEFTRRFLEKNREKVRSTA